MVVIGDEMKKGKKGEESKMRYKNLLDLQKNKRKIIKITIKIICIIMLKRRHTFSR